MGGGKKIQNPTPPAVPAVPPAAFPPTLAASSPLLASAAFGANRAKRAAGMGFNDTIATSPQGVVDKVSLASETLIGKK